MIEKTQIGAGPEIQRSNSYDAAVKPTGGDPAVNFDNLMMQSAADVAEARAKEKAATTPGGNEIRLGETKNDAKFREQLEKITGKKQEPLKNKLNKDDYLTLMVTQMKYQDPTKPMETNDMSTQLAQFNSVEQLVNMNKVMGDMVKAQNESRSDRLTQYLGMNVQVASNKFKLGETGMTNEAYFELPVAAAQCSVSIKDSTGTNVRNINLGSSEIGNHNVKWDGLDDKGQKMSSGQYSFEVNASTIEGKPINTRQSITAKVEAITNIHEGGKLDTSAGTIDPVNIMAVRGATQSISTAPATAPAAAAAAPMTTTAAPAAAAAAPMTTTAAPAAALQPAVQAAAIAPAAKPLQQNKQAVSPRASKPTTEQKGARVS
jgi:flagellar basal-body rod modification protein FlgD